MAEKLLGEKTCKDAKPLPSIYRLNDGGGLGLRVMPNGSKYWQFRYRGNFASAGKTGCSSFETPRAFAYISLS